MPNKINAKSILLLIMMIAVTAFTLTGDGNGQWKIIKKKIKLMEALNAVW